jgi:cystathionine beta-lyase
VGIDVTTSHSAFHLDEAALRARRNAKWSSYGEDVLPAFVAEMDFKVAEPIHRAILRSVECGDYGYPMREGAKAEQAVARAFARRMKQRFGWAAEAAQVQVVADLVQATFAPIMAFSEPGDGVILQVPCYPPFRESIATTKRKLIPLTMRDDGERYVFDLAELEGKVDARTRILILCNPQNPTGRVFTREELQSIADFADKHDLVVISDEIHSDLVYAGREHIPFASLGEEAAARAVTITSATKSFNIPGLRCGVMHFGAKALQQRFYERIPARLLGSGNSIGIDATVAAWTECDDWLDGVMAHLTRARDRLVSVLGAELPQIGLHAPEGTYLAWLDCSKLRLNVPAFQFFHDNARIAFSAGENFEPGQEDHLRFNFATSLPILDRILERMVAAARKAPGGEKRAAAE